MLVLSRRCEEEILIGDNIVVKVLEIRSGSVRIGVEAPGDVTIFRQELIERADDEEFNDGRNDGRRGNG